MKTKAQQKAAINEKQLVSRGLNATYEFSTIGGALQYFQKLLEDPRFDEESRVDLEIEHDYGSESAVLKVRYKELETDKEFKRRMENEARNEEWQRRQFEELKKKFG